MRSLLEAGMFLLILAAILLHAIFPANDTACIDPEILDVDVHSGSVFFSQDSHGGFHGDGATLIAIQFSDTHCLSQIQHSAAWSPFPLPRNLTALIYGVTDGASTIGPIIPHDENSLQVPAVKNGYYCFFDRHSESSNPKDDSQILSRSSFNFTLAVYDADTNILYYMEFDT